jgi:predicted metal-dependent HD superfamily phosphohydrolase
MTQPETEIRRAWRYVAGQHHERLVEGLLIRYAEPHRHYHTAIHVMFVLRHLHDMSVAAGTRPSPEVIAAALYHDVIYDPAAADNEALSAVRANSDLTGIGWSAQRCAPVEAMILATAGHVAADTAGHDAVVDTQMLLDADLAILGAEPGAYQAYVNGVRAEYGHVDEGQWRVGRSRILQHFLDRPRLFATAYMHETLEHRARANIEAELAALTHRSTRMIEPND